MHGVSSVLAFSGRCECRGDPAACAHRLLAVAVHRPPTAISQVDNSSHEHASGFAELRRVLSDTPAHVLLTDDGRVDQPLRDVARVLADDARARDAVRAERLLIDLRRIWREIPETRFLDPKAHEELWDRLVTACVEEFYRPEDEAR